MIFVTSGSMLPFDRLFKLIDEAVGAEILTDEIQAQIGESSYLPKHYPYQRFVEKSVYDEYVAQASLVIAHAGIGVIMECIKCDTPLLVIPRRAELGEHVNDHQISTAEKFESLGHVMSFDEQNFKQKLVEVIDFSPKPRTPNVSGYSLTRNSFSKSGIKPI